MQLKRALPPLPQKGTEEEEEECEGEQEQFLHTVLCAAQRWVSHLGWANQPNPVMIPDTITDIVLLKKGTVGQLGSF